MDKTSRPIKIDIPFSHFAKIKAESKKIGVSISVFLRKIIRSRLDK